jgi:hypothetical protein
VLTQDDPLTCNVAAQKTFTSGTSCAVTGVEKLVHFLSEGLLVEAVQWGWMFWVQVHHRVKMMNIDV